MRTIRWRDSALAFIVAVLALASPRWVQAQEPPDETPPIPGDVDARGAALEAEADDASARLEAQRIAWGTVTSTFRASAMKEGRRHSGRKDGEKRFGFGPRWVKGARARSFPIPRTPTSCTS